MTAKKYLQQAYRLNMRIDTKLAESARLRELARSAPSASAVNTKSKSKNRKTADRTAVLASKIADLDAEINAEIDSLVDLKKEIGGRIKAMPDNDCRLILEKKYLAFQKWEAIAFDMGFTLQWVHVLHKRALRSFEKKYFNT